jgi:hypothetical protein
VLGTAVSAIILLTFYWTTQGLSPSPLKEPLQLTLCPPEGVLLLTSLYPMGLSIKWGSSASWVLCVCWVLSSQ